MLPQKQRDSCSMDRCSVDKYKGDCFSVVGFKVSVKIDESSGLISIDSKSFKLCCFSFQIILTTNLKPQLSKTYMYNFIQSPWSLTHNTVQAQFLNSGPYFLQFTPAFFFNNEKQSLLSMVYILNYQCATVMKKKPGLKQFPWIKTIFMFLDPDQNQYSIFQNELRTAEN